MAAGIVVDLCHVTILAALDVSAEHRGTAVCHQVGGSMYKAGLRQRAREGSPILFEDELNGSRV